LKLKVNREKTECAYIGKLISKTKPRMRHLINVKKPHFLHFDA